MRELLGGQGANVAEMTRMLLADRVPFGFTITTKACVAYMNAGRAEPEEMAEQVQAALVRLQEHAGKQLGVSRGIPGVRFEDALGEAKSQRGVRDDTELDVDALRELTATFTGIYATETGEDFPQDPAEQLRLAIRAVFDSRAGARPRSGSAATTSSPSSSPSTWTARSSTAARSRRSTCLAWAGWSGSAHGSAVRPSRD